MAATPIKWQIFNLGTNNWQGATEPAPGSGILHQGHHTSFNAISGVKCYSMWPSPTQKNDPAVHDHRIFELKHNIPICESVGPVSSYRWHSMSEDEVTQFRSRLIEECEAYINEIEATTKVPFNLFIAHHTFQNPTVLLEINARRVASGKSKVPIVVFAHGTALKMYQNELKQLPDFPMRFLSWMQQHRVFEDDEDIVGVFAIGNSQKDTFHTIFPNYPLEKIFVTPNGYNQTIFKPEVGVTKDSVLSSGSIPPFFHEGFNPSELSVEVKTGLGIADDGTLPKAIPNAGTFDRLIIFTGRFADWKRIDVVLGAAKAYTSHFATQGIKVMTLIAGTGPLDAQRELADLAYRKLQLTSTWFLGPQSQPNLSKLNTLADVGVYPSKDEPFGLVFIECMACGTPVIGARSGGPLDFVVPEVGVLVEESDDHAVMTERVTDAVVSALSEDWKAVRGPKCLDYVQGKFSLVSQCDTMLHNVENQFTNKTLRPASVKAPKFGPGASL